MNMACTTKPIILSYALRVYETEGRPIFTITELSQKLGRTRDNLRSDLKRYRDRGYIRSYESPLIRCGGMECRLRDTIWSLTRKGANYAADREIDFEPASGQFLLKSDKTRGTPSNTFILDLD